MAELSEYSGIYEHISLSRSESGVLEARFHTNGGSLRWSVSVFMELVSFFRNVGLDRANRVVLLTGTGDEFVGPRANPAGSQMATVTEGRTLDAGYWEQVGFGLGRQLLSSILDIPVPVVAAVNGPVLRHAELVLLADLIIAADDATFEDSAHVKYQDIVPDGGIFLAALASFGSHKARSFIYLGEPITAQEALDMGVVTKVVAKGGELKLAREIAEQLAAKSDSTLRFTRALFSNPLKVKAVEFAHQAFVYEGMGYLDRPQT